MVDVERLESEIRRFVLENAVKYDGKPNANSVMSALMSARADLRPMAREVRALVERLVAEISGLGLSAQKSELARLTPSTAPTLTSVVKEGDTGLPDLPNVDKWPKVVMRLAPFPSGPLHIGNARMVILNDYYVKRYDGKLILVFDDTIGSEEKQVEPTAYDLIPEGLEYLGVKYHQTVYKSDRLDLFYDYSVDLIKKEHAYVCTCDPQKWRTEHKAKKKPCPCRTLRVEENLSRWEKMLDGTYAPGEAALRMKTGMDDPDPAMRDHVIMRISETVHPRVGTRYRVWPLLEFSWGIDDHELGISHIIRGKDLVKEGKIEQHVWAFYGWQFPELLYYGRLKIEGVKLSKSKSRREVMEGAYRGWDDPRTWSIQSLQKRGIHPDALRKAILDLGMSLSDASLSVKSIYSENRRLRDADAPRFFFVHEPVWLQIENFPESIRTAEPPLHPDFPERGRRRIDLHRSEGRLVVGVQRTDFERIREGELFRLKDLANIVMRKSAGAFPQFHSTDVDEVLKLRSPIIQWVPGEGVVKVRMTMEDGLDIEGIAEPGLAGVEPGTFVQFERYGFARIYDVSGPVMAAFAHK